MKLTVEMQVTIPQALALTAMFKYWNTLSSWGASREVGFFVDGDGNFHPKCEVTTDKPIPELTEEMRKAAVVKEWDDNRVYDYDPIAAMLREETKDTPKEG